MRSTSEGTCSDSAECRMTMNRSRRRPLLSAFCILHSAFLVLAACSKTETATSQEDTRMPIATEYVRGASLPIHAKPDDASRVITTYQASEAVSVLSRKGEWV